MPGKTVIGNVHYSYAVNQLVGGRWRLIEPLGRGSFGEVWHGRDEYTHQEERALKLLSSVDLRGAALDEQEPGRARDYFIREVLILRTMKRHDNVVEYRDDGLVFDRAGQIDASQSVFCLAMRYYSECVDLDKLEKSSLKDKFDLRRRVDILRRAARALDHIHSQGLLHRDIKPGNIMVNAGGDTYLLDFGTARPITAKPENDQETPFYRYHDLTSGLGRSIGTITHISPARAFREARPIDDLYAFVLTAFDFLTGTYPFQNRSNNNFRDVMDGMADFTTSRPTWYKSPSELLQGKLSKATLEQLDELFMAALDQLKGVDYKREPLQAPTKDPRLKTAVAFCQALDQIIPKTVEEPAPIGLGGLIERIMTTPPVSSVIERFSSQRHVEIPPSQGGATQPHRRSNNGIISVIAMIVGVFVLMFAALQFFNPPSADITLTPGTSLNLTETHLAALGTSSETVTVLTEEVTETAISTLSISPTPMPPTTAATATPSPTLTPSLTSTSTPTPTPTPTVTPSPTNTPTSTPSATTTPSPTLTPSLTSTSTPSATPTPTSTYTPTATPTPTVTPSPTNTPTATVDTAATNAAATFAAGQTATALAAPSYPDPAAMIEALDRAVSQFFDCKTYVGIYQYLDETRASNNTSFASMWELLNESYSRNLYRFCDTDSQRDQTRVFLTDPDLVQDMEELLDFIDDHR